VQTSRPMIALEIYFYLDETDWTRYERKLSDLIDHAYGVVPVFGLRVWQKEKSKAVE
jgi:miniconductance mechanosensitive channel